MIYLLRLSDEESEGNAIALAVMEEHERLINSIEDDDDAIGSILMNFHADETDRVIPIRDAVLAHSLREVLLATVMPGKLFIDVLTYLDDDNNIPMVDGRYFVHVAFAPNEEGARTSKIAIFPRHASGEALGRYRDLIKDPRNDVALCLLLEYKNEMLNGGDDEKG